MKEKDLITDFGRRLTAYCQKLQIPYMRYKIPDVPLSAMVAGLKRKLCPRCQSIIAKEPISKYRGAKRPFDVVEMIYDNQRLPVVLEWKVSAVKTLLPLNVVKDHQHEGLKAYIEAGGIGVVAIYIDQQIYFIHHRRYCDLIADCAGGTLKLVDWTDRRLAYVTPKPWTRMNFGDYLSFLKMWYRLLEGRHAARID